MKYNSTETTIEAVSDKNSKTDKKNSSNKAFAILAEQFDYEEDKITPETTIADDLGADSLDVVDLLMSIEDEFEIEVPDEEIENIKTVGDLVKYIEANS